MRKVAGLPAIPAVEIIVAGPPWPCIDRLRYALPMNDTLLLPPNPGLTALASGAILSPFTRLRRLLDGIPPGHAQPIDLTLGEPRETMPSFVVDKLAQSAALYAKYPPIRGSDELRQAIADFLARRYRLPTPIDIATEIIPTNGSREGLFTACLPAAGRKALPPGVRPAVLLCMQLLSARLTRRALRW